MNRNPYNHKLTPLAFIFILITIYFCKEIEALQTIQIFVP